jgi:hypothetical protein
MGLCVWQNSENKCNAQEKPAGEKKFNPNMGRSIDNNPIMLLLTDLKPISLSQKTSKSNISTQHTYFTINEVQKLPIGGKHFHSMMAHITDNNIADVVYNNTNGQIQTVVIMTNTTNFCDELCFHCK